MGWTMMVDVGWIVCGDRMMLSVSGIDEGW